MNSGWVIIDKAEVRRVLDNIPGANPLTDPGFEVPPGSQAPSLASAIVRKYYYAGGQRVAMRTGAGTGTHSFSYLLADHLGSPAVTVNAATNAVTRTGYKPWGEERYGAAPSSFGYTGQRDEPDLDILYYGARWVRIRNPNASRYINAANNFLGIK